MTNPYNAYEAGVRVQESAREWSKLNSVRWDSSASVASCAGRGSGRPLWLQDLSGIAALAGLVLALVAVTLVATSAFPLAAAPATRVGRAAAAGGNRGDLRRGRLHRAVRNDHVVARPREHQGGNAGEQVTVTTSSGSACGTVLDSAGGSVDLEVNGERVRLPLNRLQSINRSTPADYECRRSQPGRRRRGRAGVGTAECRTGGTSRRSDRMERPGGGCLKSVGCPAVRCSRPPIARP